MWSLFHHLTQVQFTPFKDGQPELRHAHSVRGPGDVLIDSYTQASTLFTSFPLNQGVGQSFSTGPSGFNVTRITIDLITTPPRLGQFSIGVFASTSGSPGFPPEPTGDALGGLITIRDADLGGAICDIQPCVITLTRYLPLGALMLPGNLRFWLFSPFNLTSPTFAKWPAWYQKDNALANEGYEGGGAHWQTDPTSALLLLISEESPVLTE